jgi:hypothetical protein
MTGSPISASETLTGPKLARARKLLSVHRRLGKMHCDQWHREEFAMFNPDDIRAQFRQQPFTPVQVVTTTGQTYDIPHPDLVLVTRNFLMIGLPHSENSVPDQVTRVAMVHVTELRDLTRPAGPANGAVANPDT